MLCRDSCGYCTFAQPPARVASPYLEPAEVLRIAKAGARAGCHEALFTLGERPELRYDVARDWLRDHGHESTVDYLAAMCALVLQETGLLPHANAGALDRRRAGRAPPGVGQPGDDAGDRSTATSTATATPPTRRPSVASPRWRPPAQLAIPFTTGILVGIGESRQDRLDALRAIAASHATPRPRAGGHRPELPAQAADRRCARRRPARPTTTAGRSPRPA